MAATTSADVVVAYNRALGAGDFDAARGFLADDLHFEGPIDRFEKADDFIASIRQLHQIVQGVEHQATIADGDQVALFYILGTKVAKAPVAEWYTVRDGRIVNLRAYFDARPFAPSAG